MDKRLTQPMTREEATKRVENIYAGTEIDEKYKYECIDEMLTKIGFIVSDHREAINKLGMLEDIEDKLGISFKDLFRILSQGVYMENGKGNFQHFKIALSYDDGIWRLSTDFCQRFGKQGWLLEPKHYGDHWAFTKEELEPKHDSVLDEDERKPF